MSATPKYVGLPRQSPLALLRAALRARSQPPSWPQLDAPGCLLIHRARTGLALLCDVWTLHAGDRVLLPAYNCGSEVDPYLSRGLDVQLYRVDRQAYIDLDDLRGRINDRTRIVHVTHYFGWPQDLEELRQICRQRDIHLVEDCALSLFSRSDEHWLGTSGDAAVFSFTKTLGVPDGGVLVTREPLPTLKLVAPGTRSVLHGLLSLTKRYLHASAAACGWTPGRSRSAESVADLETRDSGAYPDMPAGYYFRAAVGTWRCARITRGLLRLVDPETVIRRRRAHYERLLAGIEGVPQLRPLMPPLPAGVCPLVLPLVTSERNQWVRSLAEAGIPAIPWWGGYHRGLPWQDYPDACYLKDHVFALPVHQDLKDSEIEYMIAAVAAIGTRLSGSDARRATMPMTSVVAPSAVAQPKGPTA